MRSERAWEVVLRVAAAAGLSVSLLLVAEYASAVGLCGEGGGCDVVKASAYARPFGVPLPLAGVAYFLLLGLVAAVPRLRRALVPLALVGGAGALVLVALQAFVIGAFCRFCLVADASALLAAVAVLRIGRERAVASWVLSGGLTVAALVVPAVVLLRAPAPVVESARPRVPALPEPIAREQRPGVLTIVEFTDFECPYCRRLHAALAEALVGLESRVRIVRKMMPLERLHPHALDAALAWCCADQAGHDEAMADRLVRTDDLSRAGGERLAAELGLDAAAFRACIAAPTTRARVDADLRDANAAGVTGLPTYWIGPTMYRGAAGTPVLRECIETALREI